jgi:hypothetical protein
VLLIFEAWNDFVWLRFKIGAEQAALSRCVEEGKPPPRDEVVHKRGYEDRFAGSRQAGHAQPDGWRNETRRVIAKVADGIASGIGIVPKGHASGLSFLALFRAA